MQENNKHINKNLLMILEEVKKKLINSGYSIKQQERHRNDTGTKFLLSDDSIVHIHDTGSMFVRGQNKLTIEKILSIDSTDIISESTNSRSLKKGHNLLHAFKIISLPFVVIGYFISNAVGEMFNWVLKIFGPQTGSLFGGFASCALSTILFAAPIVPFLHKPIILFAIIPPLFVIWVCATRGVVYGVIGVVKKLPLKDTLRYAKSSSFFDKESLSYFYAIICAAALIMIVSAISR